MRTLSFTLFFLCSFIRIYGTQDYVMDLMGTIGSTRYVLVHTHSVVKGVTTPVDSDQLLGSCEINLFNNQADGELIVVTPQFDRDNSIRRLVQMENQTDQLKLKITINRNSAGEIQGSPITIADVAEPVIRTTTATIENESTILYFYATNHADNSTASGRYIANIFLTWIN